MPARSPELQLHGGGIMHTGGYEPVVQRLIAYSSIVGLEGYVHILPRPVREQRPEREPRHRRLRGQQSHVGR